MNYLLALDSSSNACSAALWCNGEITHCWELAPRGHMQRLLPMADELLQAAGVGVSQLDAIAFGRGPGSFTGLRVATGIVQGLAWGADVPVIPVSTLAALAQSLVRQQPQFEGQVGVAVDARMNEIYTGNYRVEEGGITELASEQLLSPDEALQTLSAADAGVGSGWQLGPLAGQRPPLCLAEQEPHALDILSLAQTPGVRTLPASETRPVYLRDSVSWQKRSRIRTQPL